MANPNLINVTSVLGANAGFNLTNTATATLITVAADKLVKINRISVANVDGTNAATVDCFVDGMGSGSTGVSAKLTGRKFIGIELDKGFFDISKKRIEWVQPNIVNKAQRQLTTQIHKDMNTKPKRKYEDLND